MNSVNISGRLGKDAELRTTQGGSFILRFSVAVNDRKKNPQSGEWEDTTHWIDCVMFGKRAESLSKYLTKGVEVGVTGKLSQSRWEDKQGNKRSKLEVIVNDIDLHSKAQNAAGGQQQGNYTNQRQYAPQNGPQQPTGGNYGYQQQQYQPEQDVYSSDIPFN